MLLFEGKAKSSFKVETRRTTETPKTMHEVFLLGGNPVLSQARLRASAGLTGRGARHPDSLGL